MRNGYNNTEQEDNTSQYVCVCLYVWLLFVFTGKDSLFLVQKIQ